MLNDTIGGETDKRLLHKVVTEIEQKGDQVRTKTGDNYTADYNLFELNRHVQLRGTSTRVGEVHPTVTGVESRLNRPVSAYYTNIYVQFDHSFWDDATWLLYAGEHENF